MTLRRKRQPRKQKVNRNTIKNKERRTTKRKISKEIKLFQKSMR